MSSVQILCAEEIDFYYIDLGIDTEEFRELLLSLVDPIIKSGPGAQMFDESETTDRYQIYNLLTYPHEFMYELSEGLQTLARTMVKGHGPFYMQSWLNVTSAATLLEWHTHGDMQGRGDTYHGYYCVDAQPSGTEYLSATTGGVVEIENENNRLVGSVSGNEHRVVGWKEDRPRITIAYDIFSLESLRLRFPDASFNHWVPIHTQRRSFSV